MENDIANKLEKDIESEILAILKKNPKLLVFKFPRGQKSHSRKNTVTNSGNGVADIIVNMTHHGYCFTVYLEVKTKTGQLRDSQREFKSKIEKLGGFYFVVRSVNEALESLNAVRYELTKSLMR